MSWRASAWVKDLTETPTGRQLTHAEKLVLFVLADFYNDDEGCARPGFNTIARHALVDRRSAIRIVQRLRDDGVLRIEPGGFDLERGHLPNRYTFVPYPQLPLWDGDATSPPSGGKVTTPSGRVVTGGSPELIEPQLQPEPKREKLSTATGAAAGRTPVSELGLDDTDPAPMPDDLKVTK